MPLKAHPQYWRDFLTDVLKDKRAIAYPTIDDRDLTFWQYLQHIKALAEAIAREPTQHGRPVV